MYHHTHSEFLTLNRGKKKAFPKLSFAASSVACDQSKLQTMSEPRASRKAEMDKERAA